MATADIPVRVEPTTYTVSPEPCTTTAAITRHQSVNLGPSSSPFITGRIGWTLCGFGGFDELAASENRGVPVVLADLKPCGLCARSAAILAREATT
jgi:hypothetical protein